MTDLQMWSFLVGALLPPFIAVLQQPKWSDAVRAVATLFVCIAVGAVTTSLEHGLHADEHLATSVLMMLVSAYTTYKNFWKPTGIAPAIESATEIGGHDH